MKRNLSSQAIKAMAIGMAVMMGSSTAISGVITGTVVNAYAKTQSKVTKAELSKEKTKITLTVTGTLEKAGNPVAGDFTLSGSDANSKTVTGVEVSGQTITLTLDGAVNGATDLKLNYTDSSSGANTIKIDSEVLSLSDLTITDTDGEVTEGRKTFGNLLKYIKIAVSSNFGEVISVMIASLVLPFFPLTPIQLLVQSLLYDLGQLSLPYDNVDKEYVQKPRRWDMKSIKRFMYYMGPTRFCYGIISTMMGLHVIRSSKRPFVETHASNAVYATTILISLVTLLIPFTPLGSIIGFVPIPLTYIVVILGVAFLYCMLASIVKKLYIKKYGEWL